MQTFARQLAVLLILLLIVPSCATKLKGRQASPNFARDSVTGEGLLIFGCGAQVDSDELTTSDHLCPLLEGALMERDKTIKIIPWKDVKAALGEPAGEYLAHIRSNGSLSNADMDRISAALPSARYALIHRIERNELSGSEEDFYEDIDGAQENTGKTHKMRRSMASSFCIYDLTTHERVWEANIESHKENATVVRYDEEEVTLGGVIADVALSTVGIDGGPAHPETPTPENVMKEIYEKFADELLAHPR